ncbi:MAG: DUF937 domain-containing protein [Candidatus Korobacteraceae bacterium]
MNAGRGGAVRQLSQQFGLSDDQTVAALKNLLPGLAGGLQRNATQQGGLESLMGALMKGNHQQYLDNPGSLASESTREDGNGILGHILGSKDVSRQVAAHASAQTGIGADILKQMLPIAAAMAMGALKKGSSQNAAAPMGGGGGQGILGMISPLLDQNRDGSATDDVLGFVGKLFSR